MSVYKQAKELNEKGISFTIVPHGQKLSGYGWSTKPASLGDIKDSKDNIGILNGSHSGGLICVDLDSENSELLKKADDILPLTNMMDGKGDYLKSHRYYRIRPNYKWHPELLPGETSKIGEAIRNGDIEPFFGKQAFKVSKEAGSDGIDFLGVSGLVVCPPSLHKSGKVRAWHGGEMGAPGEVDFDTLYSKVLRLAREWNCLKVEDKRGKKKIAKERNCENKIERAEKYLSSCPGAIEGNGGNRTTFGLMVVVSGGFDLNEQEALHAFKEYNQNCSPPWSDDELKRMYRSAYPLYDKEYGDKLNRNYKPKINIDEFLKKLPRNKDTALSIIRENGRELAKLSKADVGIAKDFIKEHCGLAKGLIEEIVKTEKTILKGEYTRDQKEEGSFPEDDYLELARGFLKTIKNRIIRHSGDFYVYKKGVYEKIEDEYMAKKIHDFCKTVTVINPEGEPKEFDITTRRISEIFNCVKNETMIRDCVKKETWLNNKNLNIINMKNGLFDIEKKELTPHSDEYFSTQQLSFEYDESKKCPVWLSCLDQWFNDDDSRKSLGTIFAYILSKELRQQKLFLFIGKPRAGKGTAARVLESLIGTENTCGPTLSGLGRDFGLEPLLDKSLALVGEAETGKKDDSGAISNVVKMITGEDKLSINRKNQKHVDVRLSCRFVFMANTIQQFPDLSGAISSRFVILPFRSSFLGEENEALFQSLENEKSGIFNWALNFLGDKLFEPKSAEVERSLLEQETSPIRVFINQNFELVGSEKFPKADLYRYFDMWAKDNDIFDYSENRFFKEFKKTFSLKTIRFGKSKESYYDGIREKVTKSQICY